MLQARTTETPILTVAYIAFSVLGCLYILFSLFAGHGHFGEGGGHDAGVHTSHMDYGLEGHGHGSASAGEHAGTSFQFPFFSPLALATLFAAVGAYGLIALYGLRSSETASLAIAVPAAFATAYAVTYAGWRIMAGSQGTSAIRLAALEGALGEVITPIPPGGIGEVAAIVDGQRFASAAREQDGREVPRGAHVTVKGMVGTTLVVVKEG